MTRILRLFAAGFGGGVLALAAVAGPYLIDSALQSRRNRNEVSALGARKTIGSAQALFREADKENDGNLDYGTLAELGAMGLIDAVLASGTKDGYLFEATYGATTSEFIWFATATPIVLGVTGDRYWATNHEGVSYYTTQAPFALNSVDCQMPPGVQPT